MPYDRLRPLSSTIDPFGSDRRKISRNPDVARFQAKEAAHNSAQRAREPLGSLEDDPMTSRIEPTSYSARIEPVSRPRQIEHRATVVRLDHEQHDVRRFHGTQSMFAHQSIDPALLYRV